MLPSRCFSTVTIAAVVFTVAPLPATSDEAPSSTSNNPSSDPIVFALNDWASQKVTTRLMGGILREAGYTVEYKEAEYKTQFPDLEQGKLTVAMEIWATTGTQNLEAAIATGNVENLGPTGMVAKEDWWFPAYMVDQCPGLPDWRALLSASCAKAFATPDTTPKGFYLGGPADWGGHDEDRIKALKLPFEMTHAKSDKDLSEALELAYGKKSPIMLWVYTPHWTSAEFEGDWVQFPAYEPACYSDPAWVINPEALYDCGKPTGPIWKAGWVQLKSKWPGAYRAIKAYRMSNEEMEKMQVAVERNGESAETVANRWIAENEQRWRPWLQE